MSAFSASATLSCSANSLPLSTLMTGEIASMLADLTKTLGGEELVLSH